MNPKVNFYFDKAGKWQEEIGLLRDVVLDSQLPEVLKWGCPCYTYQDKNIVLIHVFKEYCALLFFKGAIMKDPENLLIQQTENVQSARQMRFTKIQDIAERKDAIKAYVFEAVEIEEAGLKVALKKTVEYTVPEELQEYLDQNKELKTAFEALTPGRQRGYFYHISQAKQSKTRLARVEKLIPKIMEGKGWDE